MTGRKKKLAVFLCLTMLLSVYTPLVSSAAAFPSVGVSVNTNQAVKIVSTQKELESALAKGSVKQIVIKTGKETGFEIPKGSYSGKKLVVRAPKAEIKNAGSFKNVTIYSVSDRGYVENADDNRIRVLALSGRIVVPAGKTVDSLAVTRKNSRVKIEVSGTVRQMDVKKASNLAMEVTGSIKRMNVNATSTIMMTGNSKDTTIIVNKAAKNSRITVSAPATVKLKASATVILKSGAENARLVVPKSSAKAVSYTLVNETNSTLRLNTSTGTKMLATGKSYNGKESGSSNTTITGGGSGGSSGGSGGSSGGGGSTTKPQEPEKPVVTKKELPVAVEVTDLHTFHVYVDALKDPGTLDVAVAPSVGAVTLSAVSTQGAVRYAKDGKPEHIYGYCYTYTTAEAFQPDTAYTVSVGETDAYTFKEQEMRADACEGSLKHYEDVFRSAFEGYCFTVKEEMDEAALAEKIDIGVNQTAPNSPLRAVYALFEKDGIAKQFSVEKPIIDEAICPVTVRLTKGDVVRTFTCNMTFARESTDKGYLLHARNSLQSKALSFNPEGTCTLAESVMPYFRVKISGWESNKPELVAISDYNAKVTLPKVGTEDVVLKACLTMEGQEPVWMEKTITLDSGLRMPEYEVKITADSTTGALQAIAEKKTAASDGTYVDDKDITRTYQWYRAPVGSDAKAEQIAGATGSAYTPERTEGTDAYWYYCELTSTYEGTSDKFYSDFVKISVDKMG